MRRDWEAMFSVGSAAEHTAKGGPKGKLLA